MRTLLQDLKSGELLVENAPSPRVGAGMVLIRTNRSLISAGTERMLASFAKGGYLSKARQQPEKVKQVIDKAKTDGLVATYEGVMDKLSQPMPMGYCNAGVVMAVGAGVTEFAVGDRVASNGRHAEVVGVPKNLCAKIPDDVSDETASFTVISSIALQGLRLVEPTLGETVVVSGLGLIGLIAVQLLVANGCRVVGFDYSAQRVEQARAFGAEAHLLDESSDPVAIAMAASNGRGVDAVLITAATKSDALISQSAQMCRQRARIVLTGVIGLDLKREDFYEKEISFRVSCSYGPGRYDPNYEEGGQDYPLGYVRWTQQRNFEAVLELMRAGRLDVAPLVTRRHAFAEAPEAYAGLNDSSAIGIVLEYDEAQEEDALRAPSVAMTPAALTKTSGAFGVIGAGPFTQMKLLPGLKKAGATVRSIASSQGVSGSVAAKRFDVGESVSDHRLILDDDAVSTVIISTPHNTHARLTVEAMRAGKHVFVEKPLCLTGPELDNIIAEREAIAADKGTAPLVMVGFNRRFAPSAIAMKDAMKGRVGPAFTSFLCNAGFIPADNPYQDPEVGGGRIIGEACHFIDFVAWLTDSPITSVTAMKQEPASGPDLEDNVAITLGFADGSVAQVAYIATGAKSYPKERCTAMWDGKVAELDNFMKTKTYGVKGGGRFMRQDKGHDAELAALKAFAEGKGDAPISFEQTVNTMRATFAAVESMRDGGRAVRID